MPQTSVTIKESAADKIEFWFSNLFAGKALLWASLLGSMAAWGYAAVNPDPYRLGAAAGITLTVYLPMLLQGPHNKE